MNVLWRNTQREDVTKDCIVYEIILNVSLMQQGNFIDVFLARHI